MKLVVSCNKVLKAKSHMVVYTKQREEDKESVGSSYHVTTHNKKDVSSQIKVDEEIEDAFWCYHISVNNDDPQEEEDAGDAPSQLEEGVKATIDPLKEVNLGTDEDPRPTYLSAFLEVEEEIAYMDILKEYMDVFGWSYKEMPGLDPKVAVHQLAVKNGARPVKQAQRRFRPELVPLIENEVNKLIEADLFVKSNIPCGFQVLFQYGRRMAKFKFVLTFGISTKPALKMTFQFLY